MREPVSTIPKLTLPIRVGVLLPYIGRRRLRGELEAATAIYRDLPDGQAKADMLAYVNTLVGRLLDPQAARLRPLVPGGRTSIMSIVVFLLSLLVYIMTSNRTYLASPSAPSCSSQA